jgi:hypothetical protein
VTVSKLMPLAVVAVTAIVVAAKVYAGRRARGIPCLVGSRRPREIE